MFFLPLFAIFTPLIDVTPFSSPHHYEQRYQHSDREFQERWEQFAAHHSFTPWTPGRTHESLTEEFGRVQHLRQSIWFLNEHPIRRSRPDFAIAEDLLHLGCVREPNCIPFAYNQACSYYNGSLVQIGARRFLALMGPREQDVQSFFYLLLDASASVLVRLTPAQEGTVSKCYPYWEEGMIPAQQTNLGSINQSPRGARLIDGHLHIPFGTASVPIRYFALDHWLDNTGTSCEELLAFIQGIRAAHDPAFGPLAIHCTNGVGRTGTVIATIALLDEIDRQQAAGISPIRVSVEETVLRLSLQRFFMCGVAAQYETLYRLLEHYMEQ